MTLAEQAARALAWAAPRPGEAVEVFAQARHRRFLEGDEGRAETDTQERRTGWAVRVASGGRMGFAFGTAFTANAIAAAVSEARDMLAAGTADPARGLPSASGPVREVDPPDPGEPSPEERRDLLARLAGAARGVDSRVTQVRQASLSDERRTTAVVNSLGVAASWSQRTITLGVAALAEQAGETQLGEEFRVWNRWCEVSAERVGQEAGRRAAGLLGAAPLATARRSVVLPPHAATAWLEAWWEAWSAEAVQRGRSFLAGKEERMVAAETVTLVDDGTLAGGLYSAPVDEEGNPTRRTLLLDRGRLAGWLHTQETALRAGVVSTGNAQRGGFKTPPGVGPSNVRLEPGAAEPRDLWVAAEGALWVNEWLGLHTLDPVSGEFSLGVSGWLLKHGEPDQPVRGVTLAGSVTEVLSRLSGVGHDVTVYGAFAAPTLVVDGLMVAGR